MHTVAEGVQLVQLPHDIFTTQTDFRSARDAIAQLEREGLSKDEAIAAYFDAGGDLDTAVMKKAVYLSKGGAGGGGAEAGEAVGKAGTDYEVVLKRMKESRFIREGLSCGAGRAVEAREAFDVLAQFFDGLKPFTVEVSPSLVVFISSFLPSSM